MRVQEILGAAIFMIWIWGGAAALADGNLATRLDALLADIEEATGPAEETQELIDELGVVSDAQHGLGDQVERIQGDLQAILDGEPVEPPIDPPVIPPIEPPIEPPPSAGVPPAFVALEPGHGMEYGAPWDDVAPNPLLCGKSFKKILNSWNGWARDGLTAIYVAASGGHKDGCDNSVYRYDIQTGTPELIEPHVELNADLETSRPSVAEVDDNGEFVLDGAS